MIPIVGEIPGDLLTPVGAFLRLAVDRQHGFLLESVEGGERVGRYSFLGCDPRTILEIDRLPGGLITTARARETGPFRRGSAAGLVPPGRRSEEPAPPASSERSGSDAFETLREVMRGFRQAPVPDLPPFTGGIVGSLSYDAVRAIEILPVLARDDLEAPDLMASLYDTVVAFDHVRQRIQIVASMLLGDGSSDPDDAYRRAAARIEEIARRLTGRTSLADGGQEERRRTSSGAGRAGDEIDEDRAAMDQPGRGVPFHRRDEEPPEGGTAVSANLTGAEFVARVRAAQEEIARGEVFQVVLSRRLARPFAGDPFAVYRALRAINPSPYNFYLRHGDRALAGASPEMLVRVREGLVETRPIAGTRPRGLDRAEDERLAAELTSDPKERAEHLMLVDLGRNDVGRVSSPGQVSVPRFAEVERFSHVMHLVSSVEGTLRDDRDSFDALLACFPAGTVSGAPKVRAMEIIEALEPTRRGPYAGAVFYRGFDGALDSAIAIRTVFLTRGTAYVQAGAGIVIDSDPDSELRETEGKARAAMAALERSEPLA